MATKNTMTPSGGIFRSQQGGAPRTLQEQMSHDIQRQELERWKILRDTQTKIFELQQDLTTHRARTGDLARRAFEEFIRR